MCVRLRAWMAERERERGIADPQSNFMAQSGGRKQR
jgi:hypothetical protein